MTIIKPFRAIRPSQEMAPRIASLPYDVFSRAEARTYVETHPYTFLGIDRPETQFEPTHDMYANDVYEKAKEMIETYKDKGFFIQDPDPCFYIYELTMAGRSQTGIVGLSSIDDYLQGICRKHENTVKEKLADRIHHVDITSTQTGPIFLAYRKNEPLQALIQSIKETQPIYDFDKEDGVHHRVWIVKKTIPIEEAFHKIPYTYIADGHHRCESAVQVGLKRRKEHPNYTGKEEFNFFLSVAFCEEELRIFDYNRFVKDLNGLSVDVFMNHLNQFYTISPLSYSHHPNQKGEVCMYIENQWYDLVEKNPNTTDPVLSLDVSYLQKHVLGPILGIDDPRTNPRIEFIGGIRGLNTLQEKVNAQDHPCVAFAMYPTRIQELFAVADANRLMPPKSTWFEPKLLSGLFLHEIEQ
ncbi:MAG: DUF1015 family protein [Absicoccus porci]|uniref:DUF1015 domain-containing protein n=1 Tax=Absicoccus porci TaxID=2486576 RepID=UPI002E78B470|nr:DUF1015 family protein [Absicoccus porci]MEE1354598.1 DUF1015 family protein [Absicoccus porci]